MSEIVVCCKLEYFELSDRWLDYYLWILSTDYYLLVIDCKYFWPHNILAMLVSPAAFQILLFVTSLGLHCG